MRTGFFWITGIIFFGIAISACSVSEPEIHLPEKDTKVTLKSRQTFTAALEGNPTSGFTWETVGMDGKLLARVGEAQYQVGSNALGAAGVISLGFKALAPGSTILELVYHRPWEKDQPPLKTIKIMVTRN